MQDFQIAGGPPWINSDRYDITAKAEGKVTVAERLLLIQSLMADRFQLVLHHETRELPVYNLIAAKGGPKLVTTNEENCVNPNPNSCGGSTQAGRGYFTATGIFISQLSMALSRIMGRTVIDKSGITGRFDVHLEYTPDEAIAAAVGGGRAAPPDSGGPSIFTALEEQLGLRLESSKGPVDVLVIDHAERPSEN